MKLCTFDGFSFGGLCIFATVNLSLNDLDILCSVVWCIWGDRNKLVFEKIVQSPRTLIDNASRILGDYVSPRPSLPLHLSLTDEDKKWALYQ